MRKEHMKKTESLITTEDQHKHFPAFVEAEEMFEKFATITRETASRAYDYFVDRGAQFGNQFEDWLRAEMETLRAAPVKITENKDNIKVAIAAPGFKPNEIEMSIKGRMLLVSGETFASKEDDKDDIFYSEWLSDRFLRQLELPADVETEDLDATLEDGVLKLTLKKKAEVEAAKVAVKAA